MKKISKKQIEVIQKLREGTFIHWIGGFEPHCFIQSDMSFKISISTCLKLEDLKLIEANESRDKFTLTELGVIINLDK